MIINNILMFYNYYEDYQYNSCVEKGICSINPRVSSLRELLLMYLKPLAFYTLQLKFLGIKNNATEGIILDTLSCLMSNLETENRQYYKIVLNLRIILKNSIVIYKKECDKYGIKFKSFIVEENLLKNLNIIEMIQLGEKAYINNIKNLSDEKRSLYEIMFSVLKSLYIHLTELKSYDHNDKTAYFEILYLLITMNDENKQKRIILKKINIAVKIDFNLTKKIHEIRQKTYGKQREGKVSYTTRKNKAILVTGSNIKELYNILIATKGKDIDVYTHGEMIVAYSYPKFSEFEHLQGHFGQGSENCLLDFATFPGAILIAKHSLENIEYLYRGRLFTTDSFIPKGVIKVQDNFIKLIESAKMSKGFKKGRIRETSFIGCSKNNMKQKLKNFLNNIKRYKHLIIIATEENLKDQKMYFENLFKNIGKNVFIISLSEKHNSHQFLRIKISPDFYGIYSILNEVQKECKENNVQISIFISKCNKHTISDILNLKRFGTDNIYLSKCSPIMLNPILTETLKNIYGIKTTTIASKDAKNFK